MPQRNTIRRYLTGGYYHIYNRGVEKRDIFLDQADYYTFLSLIESYLTPKPLLGSEERISERLSWRSKLEKDEVEIICFTLMPNHFHLIARQNSNNGITKFMRRIITAYVGYFNKKYNRVGSLFQGKFKAALIENDSYLLHLSRYIHLNPLEVGPLKGENSWLIQYPFTSYAHFINQRIISWVKPKIILDFFDKPEEKKLDFLNLVTYQKFVEGYKETDFEQIRELILES